MAESGRAIFSARLDRGVLARLEERKRETAISKSRLAERYIDEGLRMERHPGIVFRDGPTGRRAALAVGPDVWELVRFMRGDPGEKPESIQEAAAFLNLSPGQVEAAMRYYGDHSQEIDERIDLDLRVAEREEAAWRRRQAAFE
jgi:hypothetical protein